MLDNVNGMCPNLEELTQPGNTSDIVKSERIASWLCAKIENYPGVTLVAVARHFSLINSRLLDVGCFDNLIEM